MKRDAQSCKPVTGLLGDTPQRDYAQKLRLFNAFARPELREAIDALSMPAGSYVLDAGCGTGEALGWWHASMHGNGMVVGMDLSAVHVRAARVAARKHTPVVQGDMLEPPFANGAFDLVWAINAVNHLHDPGRGVSILGKLLRPDGRIVVGQSSLVPDMYFAWDARLEARVNEAVRAYYRKRYGHGERAFTAVRSLTGWLHQAGLRNVSAHTRMIERTHPLAGADERYLLECIFRGTWGERLRKYLSPEDFEELTRLCDPHDERYALHRQDFHFLQSLTFCSGDAVEARPTHARRRQGSRGGTSRHPLARMRREIPRHDFDGADATKSARRGTHRATGIGSSSSRLPGTGQQARRD